jgi:hypothetical protein
LWATMIEHVPDPRIFVGVRALPNDLHCFFAASSKSMGTPQYLYHLRGDGSPGDCGPHPDDLLSLPMGAFHLLLNPADVHSCGRGRSALV